MKIVSQTFQNSVVELDVNQFDRCVFLECKLIFSGIDTVSFEDCTFGRCEWVFDGPAERTLLFLSALYGGLGPAGIELGESIFQSIREGRVGERVTIPAVLAAR